MFSGGDTFFKDHDGLVKHGHEDGIGDEAGGVCRVGDLCIARELTWWAVKRKYEQTFLARFAKSCSLVDCLFGSLQCRYYLDELPEKVNNSIVRSCTHITGTGLK